MSFEKKELSEAEKKIGYHFNNPELLVQAFTRTSYAKENEKEAFSPLEKMHRVDLRARHPRAGHTAVRAPF